MRHLRRTLLTRERTRIVGGGARVTHRDVVVGLAGAALLHELLVHWAFQALFRVFVVVGVCGWAFGVLVGLAVGGGA